jgi:hypothetical protein
MQRAGALPNFTKSKLLPKLVVTLERMRSLVPTADLQAT